MLNLNFYPFPDLTTERLVLRQLTPEDAPEIFLLRSDEVVNKLIDRATATSIEEACQFINKINDNIRESNSVFWAITLRNSPALIGTICYWNILKEKTSAEIGYELLPIFQGKGIMQESLQAVINFGFKSMKLEIITAFLHHNNAASIKLLEKNNFSRNEKLEQEMTQDIGNCEIYTLSKPVE